MSVVCQKTIVWCSAQARYWTSSVSEDQHFPCKPFWQILFTSIAWLFSGYLESGLDIYFCKCFQIRKTRKADSAAPTHPIAYKAHSGVSFCSRRNSAKWPLSTSINVLCCFGPVSKYGYVLTDPETKIGGVLASSSMASGLEKVIKRETWDEKDRRG